MKKKNIEVKGFEQFQIEQPLYITNFLKTIPVQIAIHVSIIVVPLLLMCFFFASGLANKKVRKKINYQKKSQKWEFLLITFQFIFNL